MINALLASSNRRDDCDVAFINVQGIHYIFCKEFFVSAMLLMVSNFICSIMIIEQAGACGLNESDMPFKLENILILKRIIVLIILPNIISKILLYNFSVRAWIWGGNDFMKCALPNIHQGLILSFGVKCLINCTYIKLDKMISIQHTNDYNWQLILSLLFHVCTLLVCPSLKALQAWFTRQNRISNAVF